jgi:hypothetical protein
MVSHPTRSLFLVALGHLSIELCSQFLPVIYPVLIVTLGLNYTQVGLIALVACGTRDGSSSWPWSGSG